jgi:hypothetical protein
VLTCLHGAQLLVARVLVEHQGTGGGRGCALRQVHAVTRHGVEPKLERLIGELPGARDHGVTLCEIRRRSRFREGARGGCEALGQRRYGINRRSIHRLDLIQRKRRILEHLERGVRGSPVLAIRRRALLPVLLGLLRRIGRGGLHVNGRQQ